MAARWALNPSVGVRILGGELGPRDKGVTAERSATWAFTLGGPTGRGSALKMRSVWVRVPP